MLIVITLAIAQSFIYFNQCMRKQKWLTNSTNSLLYSRQVIDWLWICGFVAFLWRQSKNSPIDCWIGFRRPFIHPISSLKHFQADEMHLKIVTVSISGHSTTFCLFSEPLINLFLLFRHVLNWKSWVHTAHGSWWKSKFKVVSCEGGRYHFSSSDPV